jgi:fucokinase
MDAVNCGVPKSDAAGEMQWTRDRVEVSGPPRIDLGGGWSDTPPFCLDWGGTVLNIAVDLNGEYPIRTAVSRLTEPLIRCISEETGESAEWRTADELMEPPRPGSALTIPRTALQMSGLLKPGESLERALARCGGGLEIRTGVRLPLGSGLGTSSILAATVMQALGEIRGREISATQLSDEVMRLEQIMTTGGGWQDQAGGIFPAAKLLSTGPGLRQKIRVQPVAWSAQRQAEFAERLVLCYTGIRRMAKNLLKQVVTSYLAREVATVQVLHSIKTLAMEMAYAMGEGEWEYLGQLLDRHWELNKVLDPNTTNAPINRLLDEVRPYVHGVKLAGAGGGGFMILLARDADAAARLKKILGPNVFACRVSEQGLRSE